MLKSKEIPLQVISTMHVADDHNSYRSDGSFKRTISFASKLYSVNVIDTVNSFFQVDLRLYVSWTVETGDDWEPCYKDNFYFYDALVEPLITDTSMTEKNKNGTLKKNWRFNVQIPKDFDLKYFPSDSQILLIKIRVPRVDQHRIASVQLAPVSERYEMTDIGSVRSTWRATKCFKETVHLLSPKETNTKPELHIEIFVSRKSGYYIKNIVLPNALLTSLGFSILLLDTNDLTSRMNVIITLLLAVIAFKFATSASVPVLSYDTSLDSYLVVLYYLLFSMGMESMLIYKLSDNVAQTINEVFSISAASVFVVYHVYWCIRFYFSQ